MPQQVYISDTNIWIDFHNSGLLDALFSLPFQICSTDFVLAELQDFDPKTLQTRGLQVHKLDEQATEQLVTLMESHNNSSLADVSCYLLAQQTRHPLLTGDGRLRKQAEKDGLQVHGVLWLLDQVVMHQIVMPSIAAHGLQTMIDRGARLPANECQARLRVWLS